MLDTELENRLKYIEANIPDLQALVNTLNDHIDRIMQTEKRMATLEAKIDEREADTMPAATKDFLHF